MDLVKPFINKILYPAMEIKNGNRIRQNIGELLDSQNDAPAEIRQLQERKLKLLLNECIKNVPAYGRFSDLKDEINDHAFDALLKFPVLSKAEFSKNPDVYINETVPASQLIPNRTGGSTAEPVKFYMDRHTVEYYEAARWRGLSWWGITPGSRSVMIWGSPLELNQAEQKKYRFKEKWLKNRIMIPAYALKPERMKDYIQTIIDYRPEYLYGYSSALYAFSSHMLETDMKLPLKLKAVVSTSETLFDFQRQTIQKAFNCPVVNEYGARDGGILAMECPKGSMHISAENAILEIVDPKTYETLPYGRSGVLLVTDLNNLSMPRLRYKLGDMAVLSGQSCACGMGLPVLEKIDGRVDDMFITMDGELVHGHAFNHIARSLSAVKKFQIIQHSPSYAVLSIIKNTDCNPDEIDTFINGARKLLPGTQIEVKFVDDIPLTGSGKFRYAIRKFEAE